MIAADQGNRFRKALDHGEMRFQSVPTIRTPSQSMLHPNSPPASILSRKGEIPIQANEFAPCHPLCGLVFERLFFCHGVDTAAQGAVPIL